MTTRFGIKLSQAAPIDAHCSDVGRDPSQIRRTVQFRLDSPTRDLVPTIQSYRAVGATEFIFVLPRGGDYLPALDEITATLPQLRDATA